MVLQSEMYDVTIIGAGPVGLYAAYYAGLRDCRTKLLEIYPQVGGRLISMYPEKEIFDVAGHTKILARELVAELTRQAMQYNPTVVLKDAALVHDAPWDAYWGAGRSFRGNWTSRT